MTSPLRRKRQITPPDTFLGKDPERPPKLAGWPFYFFTRTRPIWRKWLPVGRLVLSTIVLHSGLTGMACAGSRPGVDDEGGDPRRPGIDRQDGVCAHERRIGACVPLRVEGGRLVLAFGDLMDLQRVDDLEFLLDRPIEAVVAPPQPRLTSWSPG